MSEPNRRWFRIRLRTLLLLILLAVIGMSVYSYWTDYRREQQRRARQLPFPAIGEPCTVVFTGHALGVDLIPFEWAEVDGTARSLSARFRAVSDHWVVLQASPPDDALVWIPRENVLFLRVRAE